MLFGILIGLLIALICMVLYLLFATFRLEIDTRIDLYSLSLVPLLQFTWLKDEQFGHPELRILGIKKELTFSAHSERKQIEKEKGKSKTKFKPDFKRITSVFKSFKIKKWFMNIDTGNMALNGELFPFVYLFKEITGKSSNINFVGKNEVVLIIENNAFRMLRAYFK